MAKFILNDDGSFTQEKKRKKQTSKYEELKNVPFTGQSKFKTQSEDKYFKKSKGNTGQAIGYSALDALGNFTEGSLNFFEGMSDSARYAGANVLDFFGADKKAKEIRERARENDVEDIVNQWNHITAGDLSGTKSEKEIGRFKKVEDNSIFGEKSDQVIQGVGNSLTGAAVGSYLGAPITGVGKGANLARNVIGLTSFGSSAAGHATTEAYNEGANDFQAGVYGILSGAVESGSEMLFGGLGKINKSLGFGTGALDDVIVKKLTKNIGNTLFRNIATIGLKSAGEGVEEIASLLGEQLVRRMMNMDSKTLKELAEDGTLADTFVQGTLSSLISQTPSGISSTVQGRDYTTGLTRTQQQYVNEIAQQRMVEAQRRNARLNGMQKSQIEDRALTDYQKGRLADASKLEKVNLPGLNTKDMDLQQSAYKYGINPNSEAIAGMKTLFDNRDIVGIFDADRFKGSNENAFWSRNENGKREVVLNPNASPDVLLEEIAIHELTHDLMSSENSQEIIDNQKIMDYVSTLDGYEEARAKVEKLYAKQTKGKTAEAKKAYIDEEIVADTLGKNIGSQEYIRRLIDDEPSIAKNIYDWVVNKVANKNGVKNEKAYWNNVKNNFEKAYNMEYQGKEKQSDTKYSIGGIKAIRSLKDSDYKEKALNAYDKAIKMQQSGKYSNEEIRKATKWFQDKNGDWKFEFDDSSIALKNLSISKNNTYKLGDVIEHKMLDMLYPELKEIDVVFTNMDANGSFNRKYNRIRINNKFLDNVNYKELKGTLLHEIQHAIQAQEGFENGKSSKIFKKAYYESLGEIEADDTKQRYMKDYSMEDRREKTPKSSLKNPKHSQYNAYIKNRKLIDKALDGIYNIVERGANSAEKTKKNYSEDSHETSGLVDGRGLLDNSSFSLKEKQLEIILNTNPAQDNYHTWIRSIDDIKTYEEAFQEELDGELQDLTPDFKMADLEKALQTGEMTVYSSYPIEQGIFVTPSKMEAQSYSGSGKVYSKEININDVAWVDTLQGQYAKTDSDDIRFSTSAPTQDNKGRTLTKEQREYFKDSKVKDENGSLMTTYHGTTEEINVFKKDRLGSNTGAASAGQGFFFTSSKEVADAYSMYARPTYIKELEAKQEELKKIAEKERTKEAWNNYYRAYEAYEEAELDYGYGGRNDYENIKEVYLNITNPLIHDFKGEAYRDESYYDLLVQAQKNGNDGAIFLNTYDGYGEHDSWNNPKTNIYVVFDSNQIKNVDNTNPTSSDDIRYAKQNALPLDKNFKPKGTKTRLGDIKLPGVTKAVQEEVQKQTSNALLPIANELKELNKNLNKVLNPTEISQLTPQDANTTPILPGVNRNKVGDGKSKFFDNIKDKTNMLSDETKTAILSSDDVKYYDKVTNKESLDKAYARLQENGQAEVEDWLNKTKQTDGKDARQVTSVDVAEGWILLKQTNDAIEKETDPIRKHQLLQSSVNYAINLRDIGSKAGQVIQAFNILSRLTPEGMVYYAQKELSQAYDEMVQNKTKAWIDENKSKFELQPNEVQFILDTMREVSTMEDGRAKDIKLAQIQAMMKDKLPPSKGAGIRAWMRISMLFNPKTLITRNPLGNALMVPVNAVGDMFASSVDKLLSTKTGVRTKGNINIKEYGKGFVKGAKNATEDYLMGINTRNIEGNRFELTEGKSFNEQHKGMFKGIRDITSKGLNKAESMLGYVLDIGDRTFYEGSFENSLKNQMVLNNTTEVTQDMIDIATQEALSRTWQDNSEYTKAVLGIRNTLNKMNVNGYGLGDILIPFAKTPANLTKAIVDYSPVGLVSAITKGVKLSRSLTNGQYSAKIQHEFVESLGKAFAGTAFYVLGLALANSGIISGDSDEDKDVSNFLKNTLGINSYSIKIGDKSFTYDWAQPIAAPLSIMANIVNSKDKDAALIEGIVGSLDSAGSILLEQSFLQSINDVLNNQDGVISGLITEGLELPARAVPTFLKQIADLVDGTQRQTFEYGKPIKSAFNQIITKVPGLSQTLEPSVDTLGREIQKYGGKNNLFNVFLNPANVNTENVSESGQEIYRLYKETGETNIMPRVAPYYVNKKGKKIVLDTKQRAEYQKVSGSIIENNVAKLLESTTYKNMSDKDKASVVNDIVNYSYNIAQMETLGTELSKDYVKAYEYSQIGDISDFYEFRNSIDDTNSKTERESVFNYLYNSDLDDNQIAKLYRSCNYSTDKTINAMLTMRIPMRQFIKFDSADIQGEYNPKTGQTISGSKKNAVIKYVNSLEGLSKAQKAIIIKSTKQYKFDNYNNDIIRYVNNLSGTANDKKVWLKSIGFDNYDKDVVRYIKSQGLSREETEKKLKDLGFTIRDGRVYY